MWHKCFLQANFFSLLSSPLFSPLIFLFSFSIIGALRFSQIRKCLVSHWKLFWNLGFCANGTTMFLVSQNWCFKTTSENIEIKIILHKCIKWGENEKYIYVKELKFCHSEAALAILILSCLLRNKRLIKNLGPSSLSYSRDSDRNLLQEGEPRMPPQPDLN